MSGKGSSRRPTNEKRYGKNYDNIFRDDKSYKTRYIDNNDIVRPMSQKQELKQGKI